MMNYVVESYKNYKEENRLTTNNARKIEFITTTKGVEERWTLNYRVYPKILCVSICCYKRCEIFRWAFGKTAYRNWCIKT